METYIIEIVSPNSTVLGEITPMIGLEDDFQPCTYREAETFLVKRYDPATPVVFKRTLEDAIRHITKE